MLSWCDEWNDIGYECYHNKERVPIRSRIAHWLLMNPITFRIIYRKG